MVTSARTIEGHESKVTDPPKVVVLLIVTVLPVALVNAPVNVVVPLVTDIAPLIESAGSIVAIPAGEIESVFKMGIVRMQLPDTDD